MLSLFPVLRIITSIAILYAVLVILLLSVYGVFVPNPPLWSALRIAFGGALVLDIVLLATVYLLWKWLWARFPRLNTLLFPDLNGRWKMKIHWVGPDDKGSVDAIATIVQNLLHISMEVKAEKSDSETLMARPKKDPESGRPLLYYVYRVIPKQVEVNAGHSYEGAAILRFENANKDCLSGNYFTSRKTKGHFVLERA